MAGQRSVAAAMVVATLNFGSDETVMIVVYSVIEMIVIFPVAGELGKRRAQGASMTPSVTPSTRPLRQALVG